MPAAYLFHIVRNHPFVDGNKRTGAVAALVFLRMNDIELNAEEAGLERLVRSVAEGTADEAKMAEFLRTIAYWTQLLSMGPACAPREPLSPGEAGVAAEGIDLDPKRSPSGPKRRPLSGPTERHGRDGVSQSDWTGAGRWRTMSASGPLG